MPHVIFSLDGDFATLSLNNPPQNRLGQDMLAEFEAAVTAIETSGVRAVLLRAEGDNFSFGGDIEPWRHMDQHVLRTVFERVMNAFNRFERLPIPTVAAVKGGCFGGGLELAIRADVVFAGETARFGHSEQELGIVTLLGGSIVWPNGRAARKLWHGR